MNGYNGHERRTDSVSTRLSLLEKGQTDAEKRHAENKDSLIAVHKRISELGVKQDKGIDAIMDKLDQKAVERQTMRTDITELQSDIKWIKAWVASAWITISAGIGLIIHRKS